jgi:hypothetical protein
MNPEKRRKLEKKGWTVGTVDEFLGLSVHVGSSFDDFLEEESILSECTTTAIEKIRKWEKYI